MLQLISLRWIAILEYCKYVPGHSLHIHTHNHAHTYIYSHFYLIWLSARRWRGCWSCLRARWICKATRERKCCTLLSWLRLIILNTLLDLWWNAIAHCHTLIYDAVKNMLMYYVTNKITCCTCLFGKYVCIIVWMYSRACVLCVCMHMRLIFVEFLSSLVDKIHKWKTYIYIYIYLIISIS